MSSYSAVKLWGFFIFNFYFLFFPSSEQENLSVNWYCDGSQVIATDQLSIAGSEVKLPANSVSVVPSTSATTQAGRANELNVFSTIQFPLCILISPLPVFSTIFKMCIYMHVC